MNKYLLAGASLIAMNRENLKTYKLDMYGSFSFFNCMTAGVAVSEIQFLAVSHRKSNSFVPRLNEQ